MRRNFKKVKAVLLREEWQPSDRCYVLLEKKGISREFAGHCMEAFKLHFLDSGVARPGWDRTFLRWVKGDWEKADKRRFYKQQPKPDIPKPPKLTAVPVQNKPLSKEERCAILDKFMGQIE